VLKFYKTWDEAGWEAAGRVLTNWKLTADPMLVLDFFVGGDQLQESGLHVCLTQACVVELRTPYARVISAESAWGQDRMRKWEKSQIAVEPLRKRCLLSLKGAFLKTI